VVCSGNVTAILTCGRLRCSTLGDSSGAHRASGVACHLLSPVEDGSTCFVAIRHLADVNISGALPPALAFPVFSMQRLLTLPYGRGDHDRRRQNGFRFALLRRQCGEFAPAPDSTACPFGRSLSQLSRFEAIRFDSSPGRLHTPSSSGYRAPQFIRRVLPWNTCGDTQAWSGIQSGQPLSNATSYRE
jgi:hypothetical protein